MTTETQRRSGPAHQHAQEEPEQHVPVPLPKLLRLFWAALLALLVLTFVVGWLVYRAGAIEGRWNPLMDPLFGDLMEFPPVYRLLHTAAFYQGVGGSRVAYPPFGAVLYQLLYATGHPVGFYLWVNAAWLAAGVWSVRRAMVKHGIRPVSATLFPLALALVSFPIVGLLQRGNIELFLWIFTALGTWAFLRGRNHAAAVLWGLAAATKLYPIVLLLLLLPRHKWRPFAVGVATFVGTTVLSMRWLGPTMGVAWRGSMLDVFGYQSIRISEWTLHEIMPNHSVFGFWKLGALVAGISAAKLTLPYYAIGAVVLGLTFFARLWRMPAANQLVAVTAFMLMLPQISYYYTLVNLYAPLLVLLFLAIRAERAGMGVPGLRWTVLLFAPLFAPFTLLSFPRVFLFGGLVQGGLLLLLFLSAVTYPFVEPNRSHASAAG